MKIKTTFKIPVLVKQSLDDCSSGNNSRKSAYSQKLLNLRDRTKDNLSKLKDDRSKSSHRNTPRETGSYEVKAPWRQSLTNKE